MPLTKKATPLTGRPMHIPGLGWLNYAMPMLHQLKRKAIAANLTEARALDSWTRAEIDYPVRGYSAALLARNLAHRDLASMSRLTWIMLAFLIPFLLPLVIFGIPLLGPSSLAEGVLNQNLFSAIAYYAALPLCAFIAGSVRRVTPETAIRRYYWPGKPLGRGVQWAANAFTALFFLGLVGVLVWLGSSMARDRLILALINSLGALLWLLIIMLLFAFIIRRGNVTRRAPEAEFIRALATACFIVIHTKPAQWRDCKHRRTIAGQIGLSASALEIPTLRSLSSMGVSTGSAEWQTVRRAVAGLRSLAARTIIASQDARAQISRSLALALQAAVAGNLARMESGPQTSDPAASGSWLGNALTVLRRLIVAFIPAAGALALIVAGERFGWSFASDARPILIQFAILSTIVGLMSAFDPLGYQQRLGTITGTGGSLFGWGKARGG